MNRHYSVLGQMQNAKTPKDIERETGQEFVDICKALTEEGLSPSEITSRLNLRTGVYVSTALLLDDISNSADLLYPEIVGMNLQKLEKVFPSIAGVEYRDFLQQKYEVEGLSAYQLARLTGINYRTISRHIKRYCVTRSLSEARRNAMDKGLIDYGKIIARSRRTMKKSICLSNKQEVVRLSVQHHLGIMLDSHNQKEIEIIIGFDEWGILKNKEVDIPIIICDGTHFRKYSIEFNGKSWHNTEVDEKGPQLHGRGWMHYVLWDNVSNLHLEEQIKKLYVIYLLISYITSHARYR